jgi:dTMP kinase
VTKKHEGIIIAVDGPDGSGKTTQLQMLAEHLRGEGRDVHLTRASGGTPIGEALRTVSLSDNPRPAEVDVYISLGMHTALGQDIQTRKAAGQTILVDRTPLAIIAYQVFGSQLPDKQLGYDACERMLKLWDIDLLLLFDASQSVLNERRKQRTDKPVDYFEKQPADYLARVRAGYECASEFARKLPGLPTQIIPVDAARSREDIQADLRHFIPDHALH